MTRTLLLVTSALGVAFLVGACDRSPPMSKTEPPKVAAPVTAERVGQAIDDTAVTTKVKAALLAASSVNSTSISVETRDGRVTLSGRLPDQLQIDRAVTTTKGIEGVKGVDNQLAVGTS